MFEESNIFQKYGISESILTSSLSYDVESSENVNPWEYINTDTELQSNFLKTGDEEADTDILTNDYADLSIFSATGLNLIQQNETTHLTTAEYKKEHKLLNPFRNDTPIELSAEMYELISTNVPDFHDNVQRGYYDIHSATFDTSKFLALYSLLNKHSLNLASMLNNVKLDEKKLQNAIQTNFNEILVLKSNLDSVLKNFHMFLKEDTHYKENYDRLKREFAELMKISNESRSGLGSINLFLENFKKVKGNTMIMNLLCLPNIIQSLFELDKIREMIVLLVLYDEYKKNYLKDKKKLVEFFNKIDSQLFEIVKQYRDKVLKEVKEDLKVTNFYFQDLLLIGTFDQESVELENNDNVYQIFKRLLLINHNYSLISSLYSEHLEREEELDNSYVENIIDYWVGLQLNQFEDRLSAIEKNSAFKLEHENKTINNKIVKNDSSSLRYLRNYVSFLTITSSNQIDDEEDEDEDLSVDKILSKFNNLNVNSKTSNEFWKKWNKLYELILPLINNLKNFNTILSSLKNIHDSDLYLRFDLELNDSKRMELVGELFENETHLIPKEYYTVEAFLRNNVDKFSNLAFLETKYDEVTLSRKGGDLDHDLQAIENSMKKSLNDFIKINIMHRFFDTDGNLKINTDSYYLNWVKPLSVFNNDLNLIYSKLSKKNNNVQISSNLSSVLHELLLKDMENLFVLEDWIPLPEKNNLTISVLLFESLLSMHLTIILDINRDSSSDLLAHVIIDCFKLLFKNYSNNEKHLLILHNLDHLKHSTISYLSKRLAGSSLKQVSAMLEEFRDKVISSYILRDCKKLHRIMNKATPYKSGDFSNYWSTFTIDNGDGFKISDNVIGSLTTLKIIELNINTKFKSSQLIQKVKERYIEIVVEYFSKILSLNKNVNLSIDCFLQMGIDYFYILQELDIAFDFETLKNSKQNDDAVYSFILKMIQVAFNNDLEQFENYFHEIYKILQSLV